MGFIMAQKRISWATLGVGVLLRTTNGLAAIIVYYWRREATSESRESSFSSVASQHSVAFDIREISIRCCFVWGAGFSLSHQPFTRTGQIPLRMGQPNARMMKFAQLLVVGLIMPLRTYYSSRAVVQ
jgi:hypothetical protein